MPPLNSEIARGPVPSSRPTGCGSRALTLSPEFLSTAHGAIKGAAADVADRYVSSFVAPDCDVANRDISGRVTAGRPGQLLTDAVEKVSPFLSVMALDCVVEEVRASLPAALVDPLGSHDAEASWGVTGGPMERSAKVLRFCTIAARWNSSRAPDSPRSRMRSNPWWILR
jgi:hypothetical protein